MANINCPDCGGSARLVVGKPWCPACGWHREEVFALANAQAKLLKWSMAIVAVISGIYHFWYRSPGAPYITLGILFLLLVTWLYTQAQIRTMGGPSAISTGPPLSPLDPIFKELKIPNSSQWDALMQLSVPRTTRLARHGFFWVIALLILSVALLPIFLFILFDRTDPGKWFAALLIGSIIAWTVYFPWKQWSNKQLLKTGKVRLALVVHQWSSESGVYIKYCLFDELKRFEPQRKCRDLTDSFYEGMLVPIFMDPEDKRKPLALCESIFKVVLPGSK